VRPYLKNNQCKKGWRCGSSDRVSVCFANARS
jgi:hypothetical protein